MKWRLWHGRVDRAIRDLEQLLERVKDSQVEGEFSIARLHSLGSQLLTYVRSNRGDPSRRPNGVTGLNASTCISY